jgi:hypothetical protein
VLRRSACARVDGSHQISISARQALLAFEPLDDINVFRLQSGILHWPVARQSGGENCFSFHQNFSSVRYMRFTWADNGRKY